MNESNPCESSSRGTLVRDWTRSSTWTAPSTINPRWPTPSSVICVPLIQSFQITYFTSPNRVIESQSVRIIEPGYSRSRLDSFIYVDGAFRFAGSYNCSFWRPCSKNDAVFQDRIVQRNAAQRSH